MAVVGEGFPRFICFNKILNYYFSWTFLTFKADCTPALEPTISALQQHRSALFQPQCIIGKKNYHNYCHYNTSNLFCGFGLNFHDPGRIPLILATKLKLPCQREPKEPLLWLRYACKIMNLSIFVLVFWFIKVTYEEFCCSKNLRLLP